MLTIYLVGLAVTGIISILFLDTLFSLQSGKDIPIVDGDTEVGTMPKKFTVYATAFFLVLIWWPVSVIWFLVEVLRDKV